VAKRVSKSAPTVSNTIRLLSLPDAIKDALVAGVISEGHVRPLISLGDVKLMLDLFKKMLRENSTVRQTEEMARQVKGDIQNKEPRTINDKMYVEEQEEMSKKVKAWLKNKFGEEIDFKVRTVQTRALGRVFIEIKGDETQTKPVISYIGNAILNGV
jgi:ParB family chromosome partitioning protein